ncbi:MAG: ABC transporter permease [Phycisphaerales bacterium]
MLRKPISLRWRVLLGVASVILISALYLWLSHRQHAINPNDQTVPNLSQLWNGLTAAVTRNPHDGKVWLLSDSIATFTRLAFGLAVGVVLSVLLGILMGCYEVVESLLLPPLAFLAKIPPTAMMAIFFVTVGVGFDMFVAIIGFGVLPTLTQSIRNAAKEDVPEELIWKSYTLGASQLEIIWNVIYKQTLPVIIESVRLQVGPALVYLIAAEMLVADSGFGYRIRLQSRLLDMSVVYVYLVALGIAGYAIDHALRALARWCCPWFLR